MICITCGTEITDPHLTCGLTEKNFQCPDCMMKNTQKIIEKCRQAGAL